MSAVSLLWISRAEEARDSIFLRNASFIDSYDFPSAASLIFSSWTLAEAVLRSRGGSSSAFHSLSATSSNIRFDSGFLSIFLRASWMTRAWSIIPFRIEAATWFLSCLSSSSDMLAVCDSGICLNCSVTAAVSSLMVMISLPTFAAARMVA